MSRIIPPNSGPVHCNGGPEWSIVNLGFSEAVVFVRFGDGPVEKQVLSGTGSMQTYENDKGPICVENFGPDTVEVR